MEYWLIGIAIWIACGFLAYGRWLAHFQRGWPTLADRHRNEDCRRAFMVALGGPCGLIGTLIACRHGFMWCLPPRKDG